MALHGDSGETDHPIPVEIDHFRRLKLTQNTGTKPIIFPSLKVAQQKQPINKLPLQAPQRVSQEGDERVA